MIAIREAVAYVYQDGAKMPNMTDTDKVNACTELIALLGPLDNATLEELLNDGTRQARKKKCNAQIGS